MITITERKLNIPRSDLEVGCTGDNLVEIHNFELSRFYGDIDMSLFDFKLDTQVGNVKNIIDLTKVVAEETITLTWTIEESHVLYSGYMAIQVRAFHGEVEKWHSTQEYVLVMPSINPAAAQPDVLPSEFEQMEQRVTAVKIQAQEAAQTTTEQAVIATEKAREASDSAAAALSSEQAAKCSEDRAESEADRAEREADDAEGSKYSAATSETVATQAMTDLLAMLGSDIATLTDGKLTPSQIPPLSINDVFEVSTVEEMLTLTAERGDTALVMGTDGDNNAIVTDSYILAADDPAVMSNWKKLGISYVATAGHALTAANAGNADKINNKRIVGMTQSQYDNAALDEDTFYLVTPDEV